MGNPSLVKEIKLNLDSKYHLECKYLNEMKKCEVPKSHFNMKKSGYYNIYHINHDGDFNIYYNALLINVTLPENNVVELYIEEEDNKEEKAVGINGIIHFVLHHNDNETNIFNASDIEEKTKFKIQIVVDDRRKYDVDCNLWKPIDEKLNIFCKLNDDIYYDYSFKIISSSFNYNSRNFKVIQHADKLYMYNYDMRLPFLYSSKQALDIDEKIDIYDIKFKIW